MRKLIKVCYTLTISILFAACGQNQLPSTQQPGLYPHPCDFEIYEHGFYRINPETVLDSLEGGDSDIFLQETDPLDDVWVGSNKYNKPVHWTQSDYLKIANALNQFVWKDTLDDWFIYSMTFFSDCTETPGGFMRGGFIFFKSVANEGKEIYITRQILVAPKHIGVGWGGATDYPHLESDWKRIDPIAAVSADSALAIAEEQGGLKARLKNQNCQYVSLIYNPNMLDNWKIDYIGFDLSPIFSLYIHPDSGEVVE